MRLRGYGNAIVPQAAAEFVKAFVEACFRDGTGSDILEWTLRANQQGDNG